MKTLMPMQSEIDCGRTSLSNYLAVTLDRDPFVTYHSITGQPSGGILADFWDSPTRLASWCERLTGSPMGLLDTHDAVPCVVLVRISWRVWHWVTVIGHTPQGMLLWHDGRQLIAGDFPERYRVQLALAIGGPNPMPWYYRLWGVLTSWI